MPPAAQRDWNPEAYGRFRGFRLRPALDLLARVTDLPEGAVVDLGCGDGAVGEVLAARFAGRARIGVDASPAMLAGAARGACYDELIEADIARWQPARPPALVFSNAALHWLGNHAALLPRLAGMLAPGGVLAVQMPRQTGAPSHRAMGEIADRLFPGRFDGVGLVPIAGAKVYWRMLAPAGAVEVWETEYLQRLGPVELGHPVRRFTESTGLRPYLERMTPGETDRFLAAYDAVLHEAYPVLPDGAVLFPFRRLFFTLRV